MAEPSLDSKLIMEVTGILPVDSPESLLQKDAEKFIEEEDDPAEPIDISEFETPPRPPIELKTLPAGLRYAFLQWQTLRRRMLETHHRPRETSNRSGIFPPRSQGN
jgi:hypothetical protein